MLRSLSLFILLLCFASVQAVQSESVDLSGLSPAQIAALKEQASQLKTQNTSAAVREEAEAWGRIGMNIGAAITSAAKELGVAVAEFAQTPVGKVTIFIIVLKVIGGKIIAILAGIALIITSICIFRYINNNIIFRPKYQVQPVLGGWWYKKVLISRERTDTSELGGVNMGILIVGSLAGFAAIITAACNI